MEHNAGTHAGYTAKRLPVDLVFTKTYDRIPVAQPVYTPTATDKDEGGETVRLALPAIRHINQPPGHAVVVATRHTDQPSS